MSEKTKAEQSNMIKSIGELKSAYYEKHPQGHYFDADTLKFFGETLSSMKLLKRTTVITDSLGKEHTVYVISRLQRNHPNGARRTYAYFDVETLEDI